MNSISRLFIILFVLSIFPAKAQQDYYWVDGQGEWSELIHWQFEDGTTPDVIPSGEDNVFINDQSGSDYDTIFIQNNNATCKDLIFLNNSTPMVITGGADTTSILISGSFILTPKISWEYKGKLRFNSSDPDQSIQTAGNLMHNNLLFDGTGGWKLLDGLIATDRKNWWLSLAIPDSNLVPDPVIILKKGDLDFNGKLVVCDGFSSTESNERTLDIHDNDSIFILTGGWQMNGENIALHAENSTITIKQTMNNLLGGPLKYHNLKFFDKKTDEKITNTNIHTLFNVITTPGNAIIKGEDTPGQWGTFIIDSLLIGAKGDISGQFDTINYTSMNLGTINGHNHYLKKVYFTFPVAHSGIYGEDNFIDSIFFFAPVFFGKTWISDQNKGIIAGKNTINYGLFEIIASLSGLDGEQNYATTLDLKTDGIFSGNNEITNLNLSSGCWYKMAADSMDIGSNPTHTFLQKFHNINVQGDCNAGLAIITSTYQPNTAFIDYLGEPYATSLLAIRDITNTGNALTVSDGVDLGNNSGITFTSPLTGRNLYWVNGSGEWTDSYHWSTTSGTTENECPPTLIDNVFIDAASGVDTDSVIIINPRYAQCNNFFFDPTLSSSYKIDGNFSSNLMIWGSLNFLPNTENKGFTGKTFFESNYDIDYESIFSGYSFNFPSKVIFEGNEGMWQIQGAFNTGDSLIHEFGNIALYDGLNFPDDSVRVLWAYAAEDTMPRALNLGKSRVILQNFLVNSWSLNAKNFTLDAGSSTIVSSPHGPPPGPPPTWAMGNIYTFGVSDSINYHNIEFEYSKSMLISAGFCIYNNVTFMPLAKEGKVEGIAKIDSLTYMEGAFNGAVNKNDTINVFRAFALNDSINGGHIVNQAHFFKDGCVVGLNTIDSLHYHVMPPNTSTAILDNENHIHRAIFEGDAFLYGKNDFDEVWFSPGHLYTLQHENTQTIHQHLYANGVCTNPILIKSSELGKQANLKAEYNPVEINYVSLNDIKAIPYSGNTYTAYESIDLGNNTNWNFNNTTVKNYYWIGGTGVWSDSTHWSYTSGGPPNIDKCTPREINDVYFDHNSFSSPSNVVTIDVEHALCNSMYWTHPSTENPVLTGNNGDLKIYGSLLFSPSMSNQFSGPVRFKEFGGGNPGFDTIHTSGQVFHNEVWFNAIDDHWIIDDSLYVFDDSNLNYETIFLKNGELITNGKKVSTGFFNSDFETNRILNIEGSEIHLLETVDTVWNFNCTNLVISANASIIELDSIGSVFKNKYCNDINTPIKFDSIRCNKFMQGIWNEHNLVEFSNVYFTNELDYITHIDGYYQVRDSISILGKNCVVDQSSSTHKIFIAESADNAYIVGIHSIDSIVSHGFTPVIQGTNTIGHAVFDNGAKFREENVFDTLILKPGNGATYYFQPNKTQHINNQFIARGNNCFTMSLKSENINHLAQIEKDSGNVICDFIDLEAVEATGGATFYAGSHSLELLSSPGWIFEDGEGYIYGFQSDTAYLCGSDTLFLGTNEFNTDANTLFYWKQIDDTVFVQGGSVDTITSIGTYILNLKYNGICDYYDTISVVAATKPLVSFSAGPYCEGDTIVPNISPADLPYSCRWFDGSTKDSLIAQAQFAGQLAWLTVTDTITQCYTTSDSSIMLVSDSPHPEQYIGNDDTLVFGTNITLDAGPGETYLWSNDNSSIPIDTPTNRTITAYGMDVPVTYNVFVTNSTGCSAEASISLGLFPPCKYDVPNAFTPNGDKKNDIFFVKGPVNGYKHLNLMIFNRYGQLVFHTDDISVGWDGTVNGVKQESEVFTFHLVVDCIEGKLIEKKGNITLIR
jgi:gliding motility-associated-like protein